MEEPSDSEDLEVEKEMAPSGDKGKAPISRFSRDTWRQSLGNRPDMYKWLEAQERQQERMEGPIHPVNTGNVRTCRGGIFQMLKLVEVEFLVSLPAYKFISSTIWGNAVLIHSSLNLTN